MTRKKTLIELIIAVVGVFSVLYGVVCFNSFVAMGIPVMFRMWIMFLTQWIIAIVPIVIACINREKPSKFGFTKVRLPKQILIGIALGLALSLVFTVTPILIGRRNFVGEPMYTLWWQFIYDFAYKILTVALTEEFVFRGFIFEYILKLKNSRWLAIVISSLLFGLFHIFGGNIVQVIFTALLGFLLCLSREKIKECTIISLIVAHGVYDALINIWLVVIK